jgi:hypothetical protein
VPTTDLPAFREQRDIPPSPEERFHEIAAIFATGILRMRLSRNPIPESADSCPEKLSDSAKD